MQDPDRTIERKLKEIIQSIRVTQAFPNEEGKQTIITAYLNQNYYGNQSYGVKAAVESYFGIPLEEITPAQAAIIAGLPKSPSNYDLVRNAIERCTTDVAEDAECPAADTELVVPPTRPSSNGATRSSACSPRVARRCLATPTPPPTSRPRANEEVLLARQTVPRWVAPHFVWAVLDELAVKLCAGEATCDAVADGGLRVTTTLDANLQKIAEKWVKAATIVPHTKDPAADREAPRPHVRAVDEEPRGQEPAERRPRGAGLPDGRGHRLRRQRGLLRPHRAARVPAAVRRGRQGLPPARLGVQAVQLRRRASTTSAITAGSMIMDSATDFGGGYTPNDADLLERGPVRVRNALQFSLNIPSVKVGAINGTDHVFAKAKEFGMEFQTETPSAGLSLALGVQEVRPVDLMSAYGALANGGRAIGHTTILTVKDGKGKDVADPYVPPEGTQVVSPQAAYIVTDILNGNTVRSVNPFWGKFAISGPDGRRPATLKTGTNNDAKDLNAYGYIAPPTADGRDAGAYALVVGAWNGNSDNTRVSTAGRPAPLHRCLDLRLAGLHERGDRQVAGDELRPPRRPDARRDRCVHRHARGPRLAVGRGMVHRRHRAAGPAGARHLRHRRASPSPASRRTSRAGWTRTETGSAEPSADPGSPAGRTGRGRATSTTTASARMARRGGRSSSGARTAANRARRRPAIRSRRRIRAG